MIEKISERLIKATDVQKVFDLDCIRRLAEMGKLPANADIERFKEGIQRAALIYARDVRIPNDNILRREIGMLHRAAEKKQYELVATLIAGLSPRAGDLLNDRAARPGLCLSLPSPAELRLKQGRASACAVVARLCHVGGAYLEGRRRPSGKRSRTWRPSLHAPEARRHFSKRDAEINYLIWLKAAWLDATNKLPSKTADCRKPGPFARMVGECLSLSGAGHVDAVNLINEVNRRAGDEAKLSRNNT